MATTIQRPITLTSQAITEARDAVSNHQGLPDLPPPFQGSALEDLLRQVVMAAAEGATVTIGTLPTEISTTEAARQLDISRPTLMKLIREGQVAAHKVGTHHRLKTSDVIAFREQRHAAERAIFHAGRDDEDAITFES